jgi:hypothetical protein
MVPGQVRADRGRSVRARVVGDHDPVPARELGPQELEQCLDVPDERRLLVEHRDDHLDQLLARVHSPSVGARPENGLNGS